MSNTPEGENGLKQRCTVELKSEVRFRMFHWSIMRQYSSFLAYVPTFRKESRLLTRAWCLCVYMVVYANCWKLNWWQNIMRIRKVAKSNQELRRLPVWRSVRPSIHTNSAPVGWTTVKFRAIYYCRYNLTRIKCTLRAYQCQFMKLFFWIILELKIFQIKCVKKF
jgi:hypothetical protein